MVKCNNCKNLETKDNGFDAYSWCKKINDCPHEDIERDCEHYSPMTNADRIRSMTDEELAEFIARNNYDCANYCEDAKCGCSWSCGNKDKTIALAWLKKESEEQ